MNGSVIMEERRQDKYLSQKERNRFDALATSISAKEAALKLGITESTMNNWTAKLRKRLIKERGHLNACLSQQKRSRLLKKVLSAKRPLIAAKEDDSFE